MKENIKLICFDLDHTLLNHSSWKNLNLALGISEDEDKQMYDDYQSNKISYEEWNSKVLNRYLKHTDATKQGITEIVSRYVYVDGVRDTIDYLKSKGYIIVLISGSIDILVSIVAHDLGIKYFKAHNTFIFDEQDRLQAIHCEGVDADGKPRYLESFCSLLGIDIENCAAIGDGDNDLKLFEITGHGITFRGSNVEENAWKIIDKLTDLKNIF